MALDDRFIPLYYLSEYMVDKVTGLPLANGTVGFYRDVNRNELKPIYQLSGSPPNYTYVAVENPVPLSAVGTPENAGADNIALYAFPYDGDQTTSTGVLDLYYVICEDEDGVVQWTRAGIPNLTQGSDPSEAPSAVDNVLSNPQFSKTFLNSGANILTLSGSALTFQITPDWFITANGTGTITVTQQPLTGINLVPTNPAYALEITVSSGITSCRLTQRFYNNSGLWTSTANRDSYLTGSFVAKRLTGVATGINMLYHESSGNAAQSLGSATLTGSFVRYNFEPVLIPESANSTSSDTAYVDIMLAIGANVSLQVTSVQAAVTTVGNTLPYDERSSNREQALMGDFYIPALAYRHAPSLLTGWDFPLNPAQVFTTSAPTYNATPKYSWDQTIFATSASTATITVNSQTQAFRVTTGAATQAFYVMQYLSGYQAKKILGTTLSVNVFASKTTAGSDVTCQVHLFRGSSAAVFPTLSNTIGALTYASGVGVFTKNSTAGQGADWTEIPRGNLPTASGTLPVANTTVALNSVTDLGFNGWEITDATEASDTDKFCIVVTFGCPSSGTVVNINSISLVPGDIPCRPAPQSQDEVLRECQYYFEKSYGNDVLVGATSSSAGTQLWPQAFGQLGQNTLYFDQAAFQILFKQTKRTPTPTLTFYSWIAGTAGSVDAFVYGLDTASTSHASPNAALIVANFWTARLSADNASYFPTLSAFVGPSIFATATVAQTFTDGTSFIEFHYTCDARLGI